MRRHIKGKGRSKMRRFLEKLKSRKFLVAVAGVIVGLCMALGIDESEVTSVAGAVVSVASVVSYIVTEGKVDAAAVKLGAESESGSEEGEG
jgi:phage shock protein PspC (stress-responsive transcriptional regulator)